MRLIDADRFRGILETALDAYIAMGRSKQGAVIASVIDVLDEEPTAETVTRCGECKHWHGFEVDGVPDGNGVCDIFDGVFGEKWFCGDGRPRDEADDGAKGDL